MAKVFHYCTSETLKCILDYKTIRLSDIRKSNDSKEIEYLFDEYYKWVLSNGNHSQNAQHNVGVTKADLKVQLDNTNFLVSCMSKNKDDLHMWSCYGNKGVCIEFDYEELEKYLKFIRNGIHENIDPKTTSGTSVLQMIDVQYYNSNSIKNYFSLKGLNGYNDFGKILDESPKIKNDFFKREKEVRIIYIHYHNSNLCNYLAKTDSKGTQLEKIYFKSISSDVYQHKLAIDIPIDLSLIKSITIGPNSTLTEQDVKELLFIKDLKIPVKKSSGTLR